MRADQEVWEDGLARFSRTSVVGVSVTGEEGRRCRDLLDDRHRGQSRAKFLDARESWRDLGEDDRVEDERASLGRVGELLLRPGKPACVFGEEVEQDAAVDAGLQRRALSAGERQDLLGAHLAGAGATHAVDLLGRPVGVDQ
jgi:hypothetical protein